MLNFIRVRNGYCRQAIKMGNDTISSVSMWIKSIIIGIILISHFIVSTSMTELSLQVVNNPEPIVVPKEDRVSFDCTMRLKPDRFEWLHLPKWPHSLSHAIVIDHKRYENRGNSTTLRFKVDSRAKTGGYQCVAWYGAQAIASVPALLTIADLGPFPIWPSTTINVTAGNTVTLFCPSPPSNPPANIRYFKKEGNGEIELKDIQTPSGALLLQNVTSRNTGEYYCRATNWFTSSTVNATFRIYLNVGPHKLKEAPRFLRTPSNNYTVLIGENVTLECSAVGTPPPTVTWRRLDGAPLPRDRYEVTPVGLRLSHITRGDQGVYVCEFSNRVMPSLTHHASLAVHEMPVIISGPNPTNITEGDNLELNCTVKGVPEPRILWVINSRSVLNDTHIEAIGNKIYISQVEKRHAGTIQCFATNSVGTVYSMALLKVYPKQISGGDFYTEPEYRNPNLTPAPAYNRKGNGRNSNTNNKIHPRKNRRKDKNLKMVPPSKPNITRLSDTSVMVRWNVPENDGMPIRLFKVQYREVGSNDPERIVKNSKWDTVSEDIAPNVNTYEVDGLYTESIYKFRIAAIYANNDNKLGPNSAKFHLQRGPFIGKNPLPTPVLTRTEAVNDTTVRIYWDLPNELNTTIEGFYINYRDVTNADRYIKETVDNSAARSHVITHLGAGKTYEFKLQSFVADAGSDFSSILTQQTSVPVVDFTESEDVITSETALKNNASPLQVYIITGAGIGIVALLCGAILALVICKRYRQKKAQDLRPQGDIDIADKRNSNDSAHRIQAESKDYSKSSLGRRTMHNGCPPPGPKLTITPNPLAAATQADEDKNQNVMEMSSFNNCDSSGSCLGAITDGSGTSTATTSTIAASPLQNMKSKSAKTTKNEIKTTSSSRPGENYV